ncbi:conserved hypothetical protein [Neospora caninum Liverpool]|uniref:Enhancer of polycomb-like protein n=1 Tax=Neospora caninum (strain Liverpool) TaxID=572307 RepID=F0VM61_NEOCL|nr:conserved hypothetical protein [Neospora caninum Liverpool]CBZ54339.1 conserved hypothetical protein [Neospora caninum Liverpool]|eukprot:XP_003884370.1 conserved hypothetical protein [Neospora caninum Liverpool]
MRGATRLQSSVRTSLSSRQHDDGKASGGPSAASAGTSSKQPASPSSLSSRSAGSAAQSWTPSGKAGSKGPTPTLPLAVSASASVSSVSSLSAVPSVPATLPPPQRQLRTRPVDATKRLFVIRRYEDLEQLAEEEGVRLDPIQLGFLSPTEFVEEDVAGGVGGAAGAAAKKRKQKMIVVPPIKIEESHDENLPDFVRPDHYIRFDQHRDQPTGLRLPDGSLVHYDMLKEDEVFVEELNRRVALFAPPAVRPSRDLFSLGESAPADSEAEGDLGPKPAAEKEKNEAAREKDGEVAKSEEPSGTVSSLAEAAAGEAAREKQPGRLFEDARSGTKRRREDGREDLKGELFLSEMAFVKMIDAFEKDVHAKGGNEHALTQRDAVRIAREDLRLKIHPVLVKQVLMYWLEKRQKLGKPLLRHFWPPCSPSDVSPLAVFRPRQVGREKMTLRKQKRVGKDTLLRAERLLEDIKVVERLLRRMRNRDEKKEQLLEVQFMAFDQMRFEISDPLYHHPLWDSFREKLISKGERDRGRRHAGEKRLQSSRVCKESSRPLRSSSGAEANSQPPTNAQTASSARRRERSGSGALGDPENAEKEEGPEDPRKSRGESEDQGDKARPRREEESGRAEKKRELEDEFSLREGRHQVDEILGDGSPPWEAWTRGNRHFRPCLFPPASTFAYLSFLASSSTSPLPPSLVPPPPPFLNDSSFSSFPSCRIVRRRGRGGRLWLDRLLCRPSVAVSQNAFVPSSRFASRLPHSSLHQTRALYAGDSAAKGPGCTYTGGSGREGGRREDEEGDAPEGLLSAPAAEQGDFASYPNAGNNQTSESASAGRCEDGSAGITSPQSGAGGEGSEEKGAQDARRDEASLLSRKEEGKRRVKEENAAFSSQSGTQQESSVPKREASGRKATALPFPHSNHVNLWKKDAAAMQKLFASWPRQQGLYIQPVRDDKAVGSDRYSPPFACADGVDAPENTEGFHVFSLHRHLAQQEQLASAAASFAASSTLAPPRRSPDGFVRHLTTSGASPTPLASPRNGVRSGLGLGLRPQEGLNARLLQQGVPGVFGALGGQAGPAGVPSIALSPYSSHPACPPHGAPGRLHALPAGAVGPGLSDAGALGATGIGPGAFGLPQAHMSLAAAAPGAQGPAFFPPASGSFPSSSHPFASFPPHAGPSPHLAQAPGAQPASLAAQFASRGVAGPAGVDFSGAYALPGPGGQASLNTSILASSAQPSFYYNPATGVSLVSSYHQPHAFARLGALGPVQGPYAQQPGRQGPSTSDQGSQFFYPRQSPPSPSSGPAEPKPAPAGDSGAAPGEGEDSMRSVSYPGSASQAPGPAGFAGGRGPAGGAAPASGSGSTATSALGGSGPAGTDNGFFRPGGESGGAEAGSAGAGNAGSGGVAQGSASSAATAGAGSGASGPSAGGSGHTAGQPPEYSQVYRQPQFVNPIQQSGMAYAVPAQFMGAVSHPSQGAPGGDQASGAGFPPSGAFYPPARGPTGAQRGGAGPAARTGAESDPATAVAALCRRNSHANFKGWIRTNVQPSAMPNPAGMAGPAGPPSGGGEAPSAAFGAYPSGTPSGPSAYPFSSSPYGDYSRRAPDVAVSASPFSAPGGLAQGPSDPQAPFSQASTLSNSRSDVNYMYTGAAGGSPGALHPSSFSSTVPAFSSFSFPSFSPSGSPQPGYGPPGSAPANPDAAAAALDGAGSAGVSPFLGQKEGTGDRPADGASVPKAHSAKGDTTGRKNGDEKGEMSGEKQAGEKHAFHSQERGERGRFVSYPGSEVVHKDAGGL